MRIGSIAMLVIALGFGGVAAFLAKVWLENQTPEPQVAIQRSTVKVSKVVVATRPLRFGMELKKSHLAEIEWPNKAIPNEAYPSIAELFKGNGKRIVLSAIARNEPVIKTKVTGPGQRASLSALVDGDHLAVSIRVNDVLGVSGFVLPGDRVDVLLTRDEKSEVKLGANLSIHGSGDVDTGAVNGGAEIGVNGSGDVALASVNGETAARLNGSGDIEISGGRAENLRVEISGSGSFDHRGIATNPNVYATHSADIRIARHEGSIRARGDGDIKISGADYGDND